ncbi:MAG: peptidoglycan editing factor PgeF [Rhodospirillales bacterium]
MRILSEILTLDGIDHGFFTREGGVSVGLYKGLNCGVGSDDDPAAVSRNRATVEEELALSPGGLLSLYQMHSPAVVMVEEPWTQADKPEADAMVTDRPGIGLGILVADCAPVLLADADAGVIGAAHAGWKGAVGGVVEATVAAMEQLGAETGRIRASVGPCIHQPSYEVDDGFRQRFVELDPGNERFFVTGGREGHHQFDLPSFVAERLVVAGIAAPEIVDADTYTDEDRFFSYRRATHREEPDYGRNIAAIRLCD